MVLVQLQVVLVIVDFLMGTTFSHTTRTVTSQLIVFILIKITLLLTYGNCALVRRNLKSMQIESTIN